MSELIRTAREDDQAAIRDLIAISARGLSGDDYSTAQIEGALREAWGLDSQLVRDGTYFVIEADTGLAACGGWSYRQTLFGNDAKAARDTGIIDPEQGAAKIRAFFVHPAHARRGLGSALMAHCEARARDRGYRRLELMATLPGTRLYARHGFVAGAPIRYPLGPGLSIEFVPMTRDLAARHTRP